MRIDEYAAGVSEDLARRTEIAMAAPGDVGAEIRALFPNPSPGVRELMATASGEVFEGGVYRLLRLDEVDRFVAACEDLVPECAGVVGCFGCDWLGRPWGYSLEVADEIFVIEPYSGEMLATTSTVEDLHRHTLSDMGARLLEAKLWKKWRKRHPAPGIDECAGFVVPQFLGGDVAVENLSLIDRDVYWGLCAQLIRSAEGLPAGTPITSVRIEDSE